MIGRSDRFAGTVCRADLVVGAASFTIDDGAWRVTGDGTFLKPEIVVDAQSLLQACNSARYRVRAHIRLTRSVRRLRTS